MSEWRGRERGQWGVYTGKRNSLEEAVALRISAWQHRQSVACEKGAFHCSAGSGSSNNNHVAVATMIIVDIYFV